MKTTIYDTSFLSMLLLAFSMQQPATIAATYLLCAIYILVTHDQLVFHRGKVFSYAVLSAPCILAVLNYNHGLTSAFYLFSTPLVIVAAKVFGDKSHEHVIRCLRNVYWLFVLGIAIALVLNWDDPEPLGAIFPGSSTNGLPSYLIVVQIGFSIVSYLRKSRLPILSAIATLAVAVFGLGRGSIIIAGMILLFSIFVNVVGGASKTDRRALFIAVSLFALPFLFYLHDNYDELASVVGSLIEGSKFSSGVVDEHRVRILTDYLNKMDGWSLIFGADYDGTSIAENYGGNPHNSFIRIHAFFGLAGLLYVVASLFFIIISDRRRAHKSITFTLIFLALLRATTEPIFFPSALDFFYFLYFIIFLNFAGKKSRAHA